jgi:hypothetical protein
MSAKPEDSDVGLLMLTNRVSISFKILKTDYIFGVYAIAYQL